MKTGNIITHNNYETYMVDYWDGTLSPPLQELLMQFLEENPDIKREFLDAGQYTLPESDLYFDDKNELLKKEVSAINIDDFLVAELESDLLPHEQNELNLFINANPKFERDRALFALTKLQPDKHFIYPHKSSLKKGAVMPLWIRYSSVAAAACLFMGIGIWWFNQPNINTDFTSNKINESTIKNSDNQIAKTQNPEKNNNSIYQVKANSNSQIPVITVATKQTPTPVQTLPIKSTAAETFYSYSKNRKPDDYLEALVNTTMPYTITLVPTVTKIDEPMVDDLSVAKTATEVMNEFAAKNIKKVIKDSVLANDIENNRYSIKTRLAKTVAWDTGKASKGKVQIEAIPNDDGTLSAMSFSNGRYNYTKRF